VAHQGAGPGRHRADVAPGGKADGRGSRSLADVEQRDREEHLEPRMPPDVRGAGPLAPDLTDVLSREEPREPVAPWETAQRVSSHPQQHNRQEAHPAILDAMPVTRRRLWDAH